MYNKYPITALELSDELADEFSQYGINSVVQLIDLYIEYPKDLCEYLKGKFNHLHIEINELCQQLSELSFHYEQHTENSNDRIKLASYRISKKGNTSYQLNTANHLSLNDQLISRPMLKRVNYLSHLELSNTSEVVLSCLQSQFGSVSNNIDNDQELLLKTQLSNLNGFNQWDDSNNSVIQNNLLSHFECILSFSSNSNSVSFIKEALSGLIYPESKFVLIDLPIYSWFHHYFDKAEQLPMPFEKASGHYPIVITGYKNNDSSLGGGYFYVQFMYEGTFINTRLSYSYFASVNLPIYMVQSTTDIDLTKQSNRDNINQVLHLGIDTEKKKPHYLQLSSTNNEHLLIVGGSGCGKSELVKNIAHQRQIISPEDQHHLFDAHNEYQCLDSSKKIDVLKSGFPYSLLSNPRKQPQTYFIDNLLGDFMAACPRMGSNQQATWREILNEGYEARWNNYQLADALMSCKSKTLINQLYSILNLLRAEKKQTLDFDKQQGLIIHNLEHIDNPDTRGAYLVFMLSRLMDHKVKNKDRYKLYLTFEEASRLKKANRQLERLFCESRKFGVSGCFIDQQISVVPSFVEANAATVIDFTAELKGNQKQNEVLGRYQAVVKSQQLITIIKTIPFKNKSIVKKLAFKPQRMLPHLLEASTDSKLVQSFQRIREWFD
jgi:energy-coupling factor transporter ATP-binding protein EcfA2